MSQRQTENRKIISVINAMTMPEINGTQIVDDGHIILKVDIEYNNVISPRVFEVVQSHGWYVRAVKVTDGRIFVHIYKREVNN